MPRGAWAYSVAAAFDLLAFVLLASADVELKILLFFGLCEIVIILAATWSWKEYFEALIDYKTNRPREFKPETGSP